MKLFYKPGACSLASHITLRESGKDFTLDGVDLMKKRLENGDDFFAVNPKGQVPALLLDDGTLLTEGVAIMQYLADTVPDRQLLAPTSSLSRYKTIEWLNYIATELHKGFTPLFRPDTPEDFKPTVRALLEKKMQYVNDALQDNQWICGSRFSIADAYLFTVLRWAYAVKLNMAGLSNIDAYMARMAERPAVAAALKAEGLN
ncbi:glutathione transferase GstA [Citrobacter sp. Cb008]|jgi:glutathione S-transferase|uniref:Glutathione S-transferase n=1 Tax=Citrobacter braakii TaxID=57706 RepID=A0A1R0FVS2_CITBR|nr:MULTISPECIES: glutathione transferase GstA [Citrobacter]MBA7797403.1 glutathione transferase GstA [Citrobacter sp. RHBSTW-01065]MCI1669132.1 glutathione transferase GstA [Citrobacter freundii]ASE41432.1 glutathione transferase GstA [Citrobacter braakii]AUV26406.1 glutathione transferase GstA [Citrobacter freundii complex sp. CFNIH3]EGT0619051.1 glutathione transferase GstA [Citrobacter braakii]